MLQPVDSQTLIILYVCSCSSIKIDCASSQAAAAIYKCQLVFLMGICDRIQK